MISDTVHHTPETLGAAVVALIHRDRAPDGRAIWPGMHDIIQVWAGRQAGNLYDSRAKGPAEVVEQSETLNDLRANLISDWLSVYWTRGNLIHVHDAAQYILDHPTGVASSWLAEQAARALLASDR
jgi:hypothetical protein